MKYLGIDADELVNLGGIHTAVEITQQPALWQKVWEDINEAQPAIHQFLKHALNDSEKIILTGAGTSAFIGLSLKGVFQRSTGISTEAIATTDIITHPEDYFLVNVTTLMISFARSGNSPESVAALELADKICKKCYHLIITCNEEGGLAKLPVSPDKYVITLPKESNDISLAMTSSYSTMLLTGLLVARTEKLQTLQANVERVIQYARQFICSAVGDLREIAKLNFNRAVFLGAGSLYGTATESNLKLQEFTDGKIICKNDSYLGFRHGPKSVVDANTLVIYILSSGNEHALKYEKDLISSMKKGTLPMSEMSISESAVKDISLPYMFHFSDGEKVLEDEFLTLCFILPAQILGFFKSIELGLQPDMPSANNDITRVVEGVRIYSMV